MGYPGTPVDRLRPQGLPERGKVPGKALPGDPDSHGTDDSWRRRGRGILTAGIGSALALVILAPALLSSSDLLRWASSEDGLGLPIWWAWLAFVALDAAAVVCVGM